MSSNELTADLLQWEIISIEDESDDKYSVKIEPGSKSENKKDGEKRANLANNISVTNIKLEAQKRESERIKELLRVNEELKTKLAELCRQMEIDKQTFLTKEKEFVREIAKSREQQLRLELEKQDIEERKAELKEVQEMLQKEKANLLQQQQQQQQPQKGKKSNGKENKAKDGVEPKKSEEQWKCGVCGNSNSLSLSDCQSCCQPSCRMSPHPKLLTYKGFMCHRNIWEPCEEGECGWILQNNSNNALRIKVKMEQIADEKEVTLIGENQWISCEAEPKGVMRLLLKMQAPKLCGTYVSHWQMMTHDNRPIGPILKMNFVVRSEWHEKQEAKVRRLISDYGFSDRKAVVDALVASKWRLSFALAKLLEQAHHN